MKKFLPSTFIACLMFVLMAGSFESVAQNAGFNNTYLILQINGGPVTYYDLQAATSNPDFNGTNLGTFCGSDANALILRGAEHNVYKCNGCDLTSTRLHYRIYQQGTTPADFLENNIDFTSGFNNQCGGQDQMWSSTGYNTNLLAGLLPGTYSLEVFSSATVTCQGGTVYANAGAANYTATFTVSGTAYYADNDNDGFGEASQMIVSCNGAPAGYVANSLDCNDNMIYYVDDDGDGFGSDEFSPCQGVTNSDDCDDTLLMYVDADGDGFGSTTLAPCGATNNDDCDDTMIMYQDNDEDGFGSTIMVGCNGVANSEDCDDENVTYLDADGDGFGLSGVWVPCGVLNNDDCNDNLVLYVDLDFDGFGTTEFAPCAGATNSLDCDDNLVTFVDEDGDGFGTEVLAPCGVTNSDDCDDTQATYGDADGDGWGNTTLVPCGVPTNTDCDDSNPDLVGFFSFYVDADNDGYGSGALIDGICAAGPTSPPAGFSQFGNDCDDTDFDISPGTAEVYYNGIDDNCDGQLDEGNQITTQIIASQCGTTLPAINTLISADSRPNSTAYRFEITNTATNEVEILERPIRWFGLQMLENYDYATTYSIRVEIQHKGVWLGYYGPACLVSTPAILEPNGLAQISEDQCGTTLRTISTLISSNSVLNATGYRFRVTNMTDDSAPNQVQVIDRTLRWFSLPMLATYNYGTTYMIEVAVKTTGDYTAYGAPCLITTPAVPGIVNCGMSVASPSTIIATTNMSNTTTYRFEFTNLATDEVMILDRPNHWFKFNMIPNYEQGAEYAVRVALMTSGSFSPFGSICNLTSPSTARADIADVELSRLQFSATAYPNPFMSEVSINVVSPRSESVVYRIYDMTGRMIDSGKIEPQVNSITIGSGFPSGVYNVIVSDGLEQKALRLIKR